MIRLILTFLLLAAGHAPALAQAHANWSDKQIVQWVDRYMAYSQRFDHFSGVVVIAHGKKVIFEKAYGMANYEHRVPNTMDTKFRIGSISKTFTAAAIVKLSQENKLSLDSALCKYLDECPVAWQKVTIRQLLSHTSGIVSFTGLKQADGNFLLLQHTQKEIIDLFKSEPLESAPGEQFSYNNSGYFLLGHLVEKLSGLPLEQYLRENFFIPLGLNNTGADQMQTLIANRASGYNQVNDSVVQNTFYIDMSNSFAIGDLYATAGDLLKWANSFDTDLLFKNQTREAIFSRTKNSIYGLGWITDSIGGHRRFYHDGGITDFSSSLQKIDDFTIIALSNKGSDAGIIVAYDVAGTLFSLPATIRGVQDKMVSQSADVLLQTINKARDNFPQFRISEELVSEVAADLMTQKNIHQAIELYLLNTLLYPGSENAFLKLGEVYLMVNQPQKARNCFRQCIGINPSNEKAKEYLKD